MLAEGLAPHPAGRDPKLEVRQKNKKKKKKKRKVAQRRKDAKDPRGATNAKDAMS